MRPVELFIIEFGIFTSEFTALKNKLLLLYTITLYKKETLKNVFYLLSLAFFVIVYLNKPRPFFSAFFCGSLHGCHSGRICFPA